MEEEISREKPAPYFIGRRYYKDDYKMWGYLRKPGQPWSESQLVMLNENKTLAADRAQNDIGSDNGFEYRVGGRVAGPGKKSMNQQATAFTPSSCQKRWNVFPPSRGPFLRTAARWTLASGFIPNRIKASLSAKRSLQLPPDPLYLEVCVLHAPP
jgi:hypothetical protein